MTEIESTYAPQDWSLMLVAVTAEPPTRLLDQLSPAIVACGGWVLRHGTVSEGCADIDFEFPRDTAIEMYSLLVGAGMALSAEAHQQLAGLCQCTRQLERIARADAATAGSEATTARITLSLYVRQQGEEFLANIPAELTEAA